MANTYELIVKTVDQSSKNIANIEKSLSRLEARSKIVSNALLGVGTALVAVVAGSALKNVVDVTSRFEDLKTTLNTVYGSAQAGGAAFDDIKRLAKETQFNVEDLSNTFIRLKAAGIEPTNKLLRTFTDTAAVTTDQLGTLDAITALLTRTTGGGLGLEELERLADRGVPVYKILGEQLNITRDEISKFGSTAEGAAKITDALFKGLDQAYGGATEARLGNLSTLVSNLQGAITNAVASFGAGFAPALKEVIEGLTGFIDQNESVFFALGQAAGAALTSVATTIKELAGALGLLDINSTKVLVGQLISGLGSFIVGFVEAVGVLGSGLATIANSLIEVIAIAKGGIVLDVGVTRSEEIDNVKAKILETQTAFNNLGFLERGANSQAFATELSILQTQLTALQDPATQVFTRIAEGNDLATQSASRLGTELQNIGNQLITQGQLNIDFPMYDDAILRVQRLQQVTADAGNTAVTAAAQFQMLGSMRGALSDMGTLQAAEGFKALITEVNIGIQKQQQNEAIIRLVNAAYQAGSINIEQYKAAMASLGTTISNTGVQLTGFQSYLKTTIDAANADVTQTGYAMQAKEALRGELDSGKISLDTYASAVASVNGQLGITTTQSTAAAEKIATVSSTYADATKAISDFELKQKNVTGAMSMLEGDFASGKISLEQFRIGMESMGAGMDDITTKSTVMALSLTDAFASAGDGLARGLARGIVRGESILDNFKNFMSSIFEEILYQIIQQAFIAPLISSISGGLSTAFGAFARGGAGAFGGGGGGGGFLSTIFGIGKMFLGLPFAAGGIVPGLPTSGDSVPAMLTPGEVVLNKGQQSALLNAGVNTGEALTVNFNISAIDSRSGTEFILNNKAQITGVVQQAFNQRGRQGPLG